MTGRRRPGLPPLHARLTQRSYRRWAAKATGTGDFASFGEGSLIHPPALILGHHLIDVGRDVVVHPGAFFSVVDAHEGHDHRGHLSIGDGTRIGADMVIACTGSIEIGEEVLTADRVYIGDTYHEYHDVDRPVLHQGLGDPRPVSIGRGAFLGINCAVLPGVTIGEGACVGANTVVTHDVPDHALVVGNPGRVVRRWNGSAWVDIDAPR